MTRATLVFTMTTAFYASRFEPAERAQARRGKMRAARGDLRVIVAELGRGAKEVHVRKELFHVVDPRSRKTAFGESGENVGCGCAFGHEVSAREDLAEHPVHACGCTLFRLTRLRLEGFAPRAVGPAPLDGDGRAESEERRSGHGGDSPQRKRHGMAREVDAGLETGPRASRSKRRSRGGQERQRRLGGREAGGRAPGCATFGHG